MPGRICWLGRAVVAAVCLTMVSAAWAVTIETVHVGNPGNAADSTGYGAVGYAYNIGKYEVTNAQYAAFLNAVAGITDTYQLYHHSMRIDKSGTTYTVHEGKENHPVNYVNWGDAARFVNWLHNGQLTDANTTEFGVYNLDGATSDDDLKIITDRQDGWKYALPTADEWHKAAYYDPQDPKYWYYPTSSDSISPTYANYGKPSTDSSETGGSYDAPSPYGTYDQGGTVWEWNEGMASDNTNRHIRGGGCESEASRLNADGSWGNNRSDSEYPQLGFRVVAAEVPAAVPVPAAAWAGFALLGGMGGVARLRRKFQRA